MTGRLRNMATVYIKDNDEMLMLYRIGSSALSKPLWCGIGGHFEANELNNAKSAVLREMKEEIGLDENDIENLNLKYLCIRNISGELRLNYYFIADLKCGRNKITGCDEGKLQWVKLNDLNELEMPFTAQEMIKHYLNME